MAWQQKPSILPSLSCLSRSLCPVITGIHLPLGKKLIVVHIGFNKFDSRSIFKLGRLQILMLYSLNWQAKDFPICVVLINSLRWDGENFDISLFGRRYLWSVLYQHHNFKIVFDKIKNCICPNQKLYLSNLKIVFVKIAKCIFVQKLWPKISVKCSAPASQLRGRCFEFEPFYYETESFQIVKFKLKRLGTKQKYFEDINSLVLNVGQFWSLKVNIESPFRRHKSFSKVSGELDNTMFHDVRATPPPPGYD